MWWELSLLVAFSLGIHWLGSSEVILEEGPLCSACPTHTPCRFDFLRSAGLVFHSDMVGRFHLHFDR